MIEAYEAEEIGRVVRNARSTCVGYEPGDPPLRLRDQALVAGGFLLVANGDRLAPGKPPRCAPRSDSAFVRVVRLLLADAPDVRGAEFRSSAISLAAYKLCEKVDNGALVNSTAGVWSPPVSSISCPYPSDPSAANGDPHLLIPPAEEPGGRPRKWRHARSSTPSSTY